MSQTIHFNTGRQYTADGQRITATLHDDGVVTFMDHSRGVDGEFVYPTDTPLQQSSVMHRYDGGLAPSTHRSWRDGFMPDGVNAKYNA